MNDSILKYMKYFFDISKVEEKKILEKLSNIWVSEKQKILLLMYNKFKNIRKAKKQFNIDSKIILNKAFEKIDSLTNTLKI